MNIPIKVKEGNNCFQNILYSISEFWGIEYEMTYFELFGFSYKYSVGTASIGEKISLCWEGELKERARLLKEYHGIEMLHFAPNEFERKYIDNLIEREIVTAYIDSFDCEWLPFYRRNHRQHLCLLISGDEQKYYITDECLEQPISIDKKILGDMQHGFIVFKKVRPQRDINFFNIRLEIEKCIYKWNTMGTKENLFHFKYDMQNKFSFTNEIVKQGDPVSSRLFMYLKNLSDDRKKIVDLFYFLSKKTGEEYETIIEVFKLLSIEYLRLRNYLIKLFFLKKDIDNNVKSKVEIIYEYELKAFGYLYQYVKEEES